MPELSSPGDEASSAKAAAPGTLVAGRYRLVRLLGEGGMGTVWAAKHTVTRRTVAMKFLKSSVAHDPVLRQRFLREASAASALRHPNVVEILDVFDLEDRAPVIVMELLDGETLMDRLDRSGRLGLEETAELLLPIVSAVGCAHALGIVHRDLKPENIFLAKDATGATRVKVLDFGIAKLTAEHYLSGNAALLTDAGTLLGTPGYMAPEQATGERVVDFRADIWSLGAIVYQCLSGTMAIAGENLAQVIQHLLGDGVVPLDTVMPELPADVTRLVMKMVALDPKERPDSLLEVATVLARHTSADAPGFGPPGSLEAREPPPEERSRPRASLSRRAQGNAPTLASTPELELVQSGAAEGPSRSRALLFALVALVAAAAGAWVALSHGPSREAPSGGARPAVPVPASLPPAALQEPVHEAPRAPSAAPPAALAPAAGPVVARTGTPRRARPAEPAPSAEPPPKSTDDSLFSGRK